MQINLFSNAQKILSGKVVICCFFNYLAYNFTTLLNVESVTVSLCEITTGWRHTHHAVSHHQVQLIELERRTSSADKPHRSCSNTN